MTYTYLLAGENIELAKAELEGFLRSQEIEESPKTTERLAETKSEPRQLKRLVLTHEVCKKICETDKKLDIEFKPNSSFAVRVENLSDKDIETKELEEDIGSKLESDANSVDLENPETTIKAYVLDNKIIIGKLVEDINRRLFKERKNQKRPFSSPISLDPVLARALVNLSGVKPGEHILDPFCGTGGILIEAGLCGVGVHGLDIQEEMVKGCKENLEEYGIIVNDIRQGDISQVNETFDNEFDAVVTDLPYGQASKKTERVTEDFLEFIEDFDGEVVFMWNEDSIGNYEADFEIYIHKNLTRYIYQV